MNQGRDMDNRALIERLRNSRSDYDMDGQLVEDAADALERAEAELAKYRSAPVVALMECWESGRVDIDEQVDATNEIAPGDYELIIRPEAP